MAHVHSNLTRGIIKVSLCLVTGITLVELFESRARMLGCIRGNLIRKGIDMNCTLRIQSIERKLHHKCALHDMRNLYYR